MAHTIDHKENVQQIYQGIAHRSDKPWPTGQPKPMLGDRLAEGVMGVMEGASKVPGSKYVGGALDAFANQWSQTLPGRMEDSVLNQVQKHAPKFNINPLAATVLVGMVLPGAGEAKIVSKVSKATKAAKIANKVGKADDAVRMIYKADEARALNPKAKASTRATVTSQTGGVQVYDNFKTHKDVVGRIPKELGGNIGTLSRIEGVPSKQFHHIFMKELAAEYVDKARKIGIDPDEVIELDRIAKRYGFGLGNYEDAAYYADKIPHDLGHDWAIAKGIQPTGKKLQIAKEKIRSTDNIKQLYNDFETSIKELAVPLRDEIELFQEAWDTLSGKDRMKLIQLRWNREALKKTQLNSKAHKTAEKVYSKHKQKLLEQVFGKRVNQRRHLENVEELNWLDAIEEAQRLGLDK